MHGMCFLGFKVYTRTRTRFQIFQCIECIQSCQVASSVFDPIASRDATTRSNCLARLDGGGSVLAVLGGALGDGLGLVAGGGTLELLANGLDGRSAGVGDGGSAAEVGVDTGKELAVVGLWIIVRHFHVRMLMG
jgi:hypothetical protein